jgi:hypothetical protein
MQAFNTARDAGEAAMTAFYARIAAPHVSAPPGMS